MKRQEFIEKLESFGLPRSEYMIRSGGSLLLRGFREETADFDLCVSKELAEKLDLEHCAKDEVGSYVPFENVQMKPTLGQYPFDVIDGYQCETLESILALKRELMRPKDLRDIAVIEEVLARTQHTDYSLEERFVKAFIRKSRRERMLYLLTTPEKRYEGVDRFCHEAGDLLDPAKIAMEGEDLDRRPEFRRFVEKNKNAMCYLLSPDFWLDEQFKPLNEAVGLAVMCPDAALVIGDDFAIVFGEPMKGGRGKYLLAEKSLI